MSPEKKNTSSTSRILVIAIISLLIGGGAVYVAAPSLVGKTTQTQIQTVTQGSTVVSIGTSTVTQTQTTTTTQTTSATLGAVALTTVATQSAPTSATSGWANSWSQEFQLGLVAEFPNSSAGPAAWDASAHPHVFFTTNTPGGGSGCSNCKNTGVAVIDADTKQVITTMQYTIAGVTMYYGPMGMGASMDGKYLYLPTGNAL